MLTADVSKFLTQIYTQYQSDYVELDPIEFLHQYSNSVDQEIVGFLSAALAIGRVELFRKALIDIFKIIGPSPHEYVKAFNPTKNASDFEGFVYRFYKGQDIALLFWWLHQIYTSHATLEDFFLQGFDSNDETIEKGLKLFVQNILNLDTLPITQNQPAKGSGIRHFLANPNDNSACKRLNLFLRWMVRKDNLDLGIWKNISPSQLIVPLDTHIARLSRCLGLSNRKSPGWRMAVEITRQFKELDPKDPIKFDFALCTIGKLYACPANPSDASCKLCPIAPHCLTKNTAAF